MSHFVESFCKVTVDAGGKKKVFTYTPIKANTIKTFELWMLIEDFFHKYLYQT